MDKEQLHRRLIATFVAELSDHVPALERDILALEKKPERAERARLFEALLRTMHTLKGAAGSVGAAPVVSVAHRLEEIFLAASRGTLPSDQAFFDLVFPSVDAIADAGRRLKAGETLTGTAIAEAALRLTAFGPSSTSRPPSPSGAARNLPSMPQEPAAGAVGEAAAAETTGKDPVAAHSSGQATAETVRVPAVKLDELLARSGELLTTRHRFDDRYDSAAGLADLAAELGKSWRRIEVEIGGAVRSERADRRGDTPLPGRSRRELSRLLGRYGDLASRLERDAQALVSGLDADRRALHQTSMPLDEEIRRLRMLPFANACDGLERLVRDLTAANGKRVELDVQGGDIEIDRSLLEGMKEALLHIVRNAVDHGIEAPAARRSSGKSEIGHITIKGALDGPHITVSVSDDGRGMDLQAIRDRLKEAGKPIPDDQRELIRSVLLPGFSTAKSVSTVSGRGVGLDVVATRVAGLRGSVDLQSEPLRGTRILLTAPLTLTTVRAVLVRVGTRIFAIESTAVQRVLRVGSDALKSIEGYDAVMAEGQLLPIAPLAAVLGISSPEPAADLRPAIILTGGGRAAVFMIDEAVAERELVVTGLGSRLRKVPYILGASIMPDGSVGLILDANTLVASTLKRSTRMSRSTDSPGEAVRKRLLVVDDSLTVRMLEKSILEAEGYDVIVASDGNEAWKLLLNGGVDLVISDVEMPSMDGFSLTESIRASNQYRALPVILVTGKESDADKARGMKVGANAYLLKSAFDQKELLATIAQIL